MVTKHKIWASAGVVAIAAGVVAGRQPHLLWPAHRAATDRGEPGGVGEKLPTSSIESGEAGERAPAVEDGETGERSVTDDGGEHGAPQAAAGPNDFAGGAFDAALAEVLGGEGGKDGLGIGPMTETAGQWSFSVPALTGPQVTKAVAGHSLRSERHFAMHFAPDGRYGGWSLSWSKGAMSQCPKRSGPDYGVYDGECWVGRENTLIGSWAVRGNLLCLTPAPIGVTQGRDCVRTALMLNSLVFFGRDGRMVGKGAELVPGNNIGRERSS